MRISSVTLLLLFLMSLPALGTDPSWPLPPSPWTTTWPPMPSTSAPPATETAPPDWKDPSCVVYTISNSLAALHPSMNEVLQFVRNLDPKLVSMEKTPGWQEFEDLKNAISKLKSAKLDLASQGKLEQAKKWATDAEAQLKKDPKLTAIVSQVRGANLSNAYQPGERALKRLYVKLLYSLDREIPSPIRVPFKHLPIDPRPPKLLEAGRKIVSDQETRFAQQYSSTGFPDDASFRNALKAMGGDYQKALNVLDQGRFEFAMNRPENARWWVPKVGFENQRTSGSSRGTMNPDYRDQVEAKLTGTKLSVYKTFDNELKPEYGYLKPTPDLGLQQSHTGDGYGSDVYVFKKDRVKDRVTWTGGDSFGVVGYAGDDSENPAAKTWQGFFVPWKNRSLMVPTIQDNFAAKVGFEGRWVDTPTTVYTPGTPPPAPAMPTIPFPSSEGIVPPKPPEPTPPPLPALSMDASMYIDFFSSTATAGAFPTLPAGTPGFSPGWIPPGAAVTLPPGPTIMSPPGSVFVPPGLPSFSPPSLDSKLLPDAPATAVDAFAKWKEETKAAMESPEYKAYEAALVAYKNSDTYKAWDAAEKAYETGPTMTAYKDAYAAYDKAMKDYYASDVYKAYMDAESKRMADFNAASMGTGFKGTPLEPFKYNKPFGYIELQYFGPVTLDDVETFEFRQNPPSGEFLEELKKRGIKIRDGRVDPAVEWKEGTP